MDLSLILIAGAFVGLALVVGLWLRRRSVTWVNPPPARMPGADTRALRALNLPPAVEAKLDDQISQGKKIQAIKLLREHTGWGLKESKEYLDALVAGRPITNLPSTSREVMASGDDSDLDRQIRELLAQRRKVEAVKLVRERKGWGLKQSKDYVDSLERQMRP